MKQVLALLVLTSSLSAVPLTGSRTLHHRSRRQSQCPDQPADIHFLLDASGSVQETNFQTQLQFVANLADTFDVRDSRVRIGVTTFSTGVNQQFFMNAYTNKTELIAGILAIQYARGDTATAEGLKFVRENAFLPQNGGRDNVVDVLIVTTDGQSNFPDDTKSESDLIHAAGIATFAVGIGSNINQEELQAIASDPLFVFDVDDFNALTAIEEELQTAICQEVIPQDATVPPQDPSEFICPDPDPNGYYFADVTNKCRYYQCDTMRGYYLRTCAPGTKWVQDLRTCNFLTVNEEGCPAFTYGFGK